MRIAGARAPILLAFGLLVGSASPSASQPPQADPAPTAAPIAVAHRFDPPVAPAFEPAAAPDARVSTSPGLETLPSTDSNPDEPARPLDATAKPLTRAAARHRLETVSPTAWLARFGNVTIERRSD